MRLLALISSILTIGIPLQNSVHAMRTETGGFLIGRLCHHASNDTVCCVEKQSIGELTSKYPSIYPPNFHKLDTSFPEDRFVNTDPSGRHRSRWSCEIPSRWTPGLVEPYSVTIWFGELYEDGPYGPDEMRVVSPRCAAQNVQLECRYC